MTGTPAINVADIVEENGKTIRQNNLEKKHNIPIGSLVEVKYDTWFGDGACEKVLARMWVVSHDRDCDGTPLYTLSPHKSPIFEDFIITIPNSNEMVQPELKRSLLNNHKSGFSEDSLKVIETSQEIKDGVGALEWGKMVQPELKRSLLNNHKSGFSEDSLKVIEVSQEIKDGVGALEWGKNE